MSNFRLQSLYDRIGATYDVYDLQNKPLTVAVAVRGSIEFSVLESLMPGKVFDNFPAALAALPSVPVGQNGLAANVANDYMSACIYVAKGVHSSATPIVVGATKSGTRIYCEKGSIIQATANLGVNTAGLIELQGEELQLVGYPKLTTNTGDPNLQAGCALIVGGNLNSSSGEGIGRGALIQNLTIDGNGGNRDFANCLTIRGAADVVVENSRLYGFTDTASSIIRIIDSSFGRDGGKTILRNVIAYARSDSGNTAEPLIVAVNQDHGEIYGGAYVTDSATTKPIAIAATNWTLTDGGLAANAAAVGNKVHVDVTGSAPKIGQWYVKQVGGATAATLLSQANV